MHFQEITFFDLHLGVRKCCPVPSTSCEEASAKFNIATSNGLEGDVFTRNVTDGRIHVQTEGWTDRLLYEINIPFFGTRDLFNISYSRELYLFSKFLHFEEIVRVKMAVCFEMIVSET